ncbi:MAG: FAD-dependent oxidoreductase [Ilumatobacteraceae bacterium]
MSRVVVLGAGVSGHTAALHLRRLLGRGHEVVVVSPNSRWNWIPSNIWVGVGKMTSEQVTFPLAPIYERRGIHFHQAKAVALLPEGDRDDPRGAVEIVSTAPHNGGTTQLLRYDYLVNATGPKLRFEATPGLGPDGNSVSVCSATHATQAAAALDAAIERMRAGQRQTLVVGMGHGTCTCEGAAFEYVFNVDHTLREAGVRELAEVIYLTNEHELGDFGVGGMVLEHGGEARTSEEWMAGLFAEARHQGDPRCPRDRGPSERGRVRDDRGRVRRAAVRLRHAAASLRGRRLAGVRPTRDRHHRTALRPERLHACRCRVHEQAVRGLGGGRLAVDVSEP